MAKTDSAEKVKVSLMSPLAYKASKDADAIRYARGIQEMPIEHARALGVTHRIVGESAVSSPKSAVSSQPFNGAFDDSLAAILSEAGYGTLDDLRKATQDELRAIGGIGPANYERIQHALKGE